ncbi:WbqC family protein [Caballeronia sp. LZ062]|uniref:WbqC family protein n=1 Tax=unclassified Caballeronia TaxID=2646786 RepID=UPI002854FEF1|nr:MULTISPECIES: WbqC family protein [unclassified Caballeronia]MDR5853370.1 WbqC family protein [Caballeronia sp. LZ050]MDR5872095.1 WbqC family protein [Caballeronia sp. LZ062]
MKVAIMQPYFLPYIGYFQLIGAVDVFVVYDNIKYTKKGWFNRNRFLQNGGDAYFSIPLVADSDSLDVVARSIAPSFDRQKLLNQIQGAYRRAPHFAQGFELLRECVEQEERNLFHFLHHSIRATNKRLSLDTRIVVSSTLPIDHSLRAQDKVLAICGALGATTYINAIGGTALYSAPDFAERGIELRFLQPRALEYRQFGEPFVPWLSILDLLMFNPADEVEAMLGEFDLV